MSRYIEEFPGVGTAEKEDLLPDGDPTDGLTTNDHWFGNGLAKAPCAGRGWCVFCGLRYSVRREVNFTLGRLLTQAEATETDPRRLAAQKSLIKREMWDLVRELTDDVQRVVNNCANQKTQEEMQKTQEATGSQQ